MVGFRIVIIGRGELSAGASAGACGGASAGGGGSGSPLMPAGPRDALRPASAAATGAPASGCRRTRAWLSTASRMPTGSTGMGMAIAARAPIGSTAAGSARATETCDMRIFRRLDRAAAFLADPACTLGQLQRALPAVARPSRTARRAETSRRSQRAAPARRTRRTGEILCLRPDVRRWPPVGGNRHLAGAVGRHWPPAAGTIDRPEVIGTTQKAQSGSRRGRSCLAAVVDIARQLDLVPALGVDVACQRPSLAHRLGCREIRFPPAALASKTQLRPNGCSCRAPRSAQGALARRCR